MGLYPPAKIDDGADQEEDGVCDEDRAHEEVGAWMKMVRTLTSMGTQKQQCLMSEDRLVSRMKQDMPKPKNLEARMS